MQDFRASCQVSDLSTWRIIIYLGTPSLDLDQVGLVSNLLDFMEYTIKQQDEGVGVKVIHLAFSKAFD